MVVLLAVAAPVTTRVARHYSWSLLISVVYKLWQWRTRMEQNSDVRRVHGTRHLWHIFPVVLYPTYGESDALGSFLQTRKAIRILSTVCPRSTRSVRSPSPRGLPPHGQISSETPNLITLSGREICTYSGLSPKGGECTVSCWALTAI